MDWRTTAISLFCVENIKKRASQLSAALRKEVEAVTGDPHLPDMIDSVESLHKLRVSIQDSSGKSAFGNKNQAGLYT